MNIKLSMNRTGFNGVAAKPGRNRDAFADPLEGEEWNDLGWSIPLVARMVAGIRPEAKNHRQIKQVQRFTAPAGVKNVCVS